MQYACRGSRFLSSQVTMRKPCHTPCEMPSIRACCHWFASVMRRLSSLLRLRRRSRPEADPRTGAPFRPSSGNWRRLTATSHAPGRRFLLRHATTETTFSVLIYDTRTSLCWRCDFRTQYERNTYLNNLRAGSPSAWPQALVLTESRQGQPQR